MASVPTGAWKVFPFRPLSNWPPGKGSMRMANYPTMDEESADDLRSSLKPDGSQFDSGRPYMKHKIYKSQIPGLAGHYLWHVECPERTTTYDYVSYQAAIRMRGCCKSNPRIEYPDTPPTQRVALTKEQTAYLRLSKWGSG